MTLGEFRKITKQYPDNTEIIINYGYSRLRETLAWDGEIAPLPWERAKKERFLNFDVTESRFHNPS